MRSRSRLAKAATSLVLASGLAVAFTPTGTSAREARDPAISGRLAQAHAAEIKGDHKTAIGLLEAVVQRLRSHYPDRVMPQAYVSFALGTALDNDGQFARARDILAPVLEILVKAEPTDLITGGAAMTLALASFELQDFAETVRAGSIALPILESRHYSAEAIAQLKVRVSAARRSLGQLV